MASSEAKISVLIPRTQTDGVQFVQAVKVVLVNLSNVTSVSPAECWRLRL